MNLQDALVIAPGVGVGIGLAIHFARQRRMNAQLASKVLSELSRNESLTLPELVTRAGLSDGFMNRGKLMNAINPMVASGQLSQEEPPGTTMRNRLSVLRFRLRALPDTH